MKKKLLSVFLILTLSVAAMSSCMLLERDTTFDTNGNGVSDTIINVEGGPSYENITINSGASQNLLAASKAMLSSVSIKCAFEVKQYNSYGAYIGTASVASASSGVIYKLDKNNGDAYIITNFHAVYDADSTTADGISDEIYVYLYGMEYATNGGGNYAISATYVGGSMMYDIAVLKVEDSAVLMSSSARAADIADSNNIAVLDTAIAVGNPDNAGLSATVGYVSVDSESIEVAFETSEGTTPVELRVMRTDAAVNYGNSGGGLFNDRGELIGIVCAKTSNKEIENMGYAIPSNVAKAIAENAIHYSDGTIKRAILGITVGVNAYSTKYDTETGKVHKLEEVVISAITSNTVKNTLSVGDIINSITVDGKTQKVTRIHHVVDSMLYAKAGSTVVINITRAGVTSDKTITVTESMITTY